MPPRTCTFTHGDREHQVEVLDHERVRVGDLTYHVRRNGDGTIRITGDRTEIAWAAAEGDLRWVFLDGHVYEFGTERRQPRRRGAGHHGTLAAPMPATVRRVLVAVGDRVTRGDTLIILEAMKMELPVRAGVAGTVEAVHCDEGQLVQPGVTLIDITEG